MKLTRKLTIAIAIVLTVQFALYGYFVARRLTGFLEHDIKQDALQIGRALALATSQAWKNRGQQDAMDLIGAANSDYTDLQIRLVSLDPLASIDLKPALPAEDLSPLKSGSYLVKHVYPDSNSDYVYTYYRLSTDSINQQAAIELRESFAPENWFTIVSVIRVMAFLAIVVASTAALMWFLGVVLIARPIEQLRKKARRVGQGDFSDHIEVIAGDEIGELAKEINLMNDELLRARERIEKEAAARISALEQLRHADRLTTIGTLASGVAHELGTPLTVANGYLDRLRAVCAANEQTNLCVPIAQQLEKMDGIVKQLLHYSRRKPLNKKPTPLVEIVQRVITMLEAFAAKRNIRISTINSSVNSIAEVDETQIEQVLANVIINAVQAMNKGAITVTLTNGKKSQTSLQGQFSGEYHCIEISDTGEGMTQEQIAQIFNPFYTTKEPGHGTGMGLSIAQGIVEEHNGWISVDSTPGTGSQFSIYIPVTTRQTLVGPE